MWVIMVCLHSAGTLLFTQQHLGVDRYFTPGFANAIGTGMQCFTGFINGCHRSQCIPICQVHYAIKNKFSIVNCGIGQRNRLGLTV